MQSDADARPLDPKSGALTAALRSLVLTVSLCF